MAEVLSFAACVVAMVVAAVDMAVAFDAPVAFAVAAVRSGGVRSEAALPVVAMSVVTPFAGVAGVATSWAA